MWTLAPWRGSSRRCADDADAGGRPGLAGDRPHRYAKGLRRAGADRPGDVEARSAFRASVRVPRSARRSDQVPVVGRPGALPVCQAAGAEPVSLAFDRGRGGDDIGRATRLSAVRYRLANAAGNMASDSIRI